MSAPSLTVSSKSAAPVASSSTPVATAAELTPTQTRVNNISSLQTLCRSFTDDPSTYHKSLLDCQARFELLPRPLRMRAYTYFGEANLLLQKKDFEGVKKQMAQLAEALDKPTLERERVKTAPSKKTTEKKETAHKRERSTSTPSLPSPEALDSSILKLAEQVKFESENLTAYFWQFILAKQMKDPEVTKTAEKMKDGLTAFKKDNPEKADLFNQLFLLCKRKFILQNPAQFDLIEHCKV